MVREVPNLLLMRDYLVRSGPFSFIARSLAYSLSPSGLQLSSPKSVCVVGLTLCVGWGIQIGNPLNPEKRVASPADDACVGGLDGVYYWSY